MTTRRRSAPRTGRVREFDPAAGYGTIVDGTDAWFFHCTAIVDGSRTIREGREVAFVVCPGHLGRWEAADVVPCD